MEPTDVTVEILRSIRDEVRGVRDEVRITNERVDHLEHATAGRLDHVEHAIDRLERRQTETEIRLATEIVAVAGAVHEVRDLLRDELGLRRQVQDHERRLQSLEGTGG